MRINLLFDIKDSHFDSLHLHFVFVFKKNFIELNYIFLNIQNKLKGIYQSNKYNRKLCNINIFQKIIIQIETKTMDL